jgi:hypothetical protein
MNIFNPSYFEKHQSDRLDFVFNKKGILYLKSIGFSIVLIGILEGVAEATAGLSKGYFGARM